MKIIKQIIIMIKILINYQMLLTLIYLTYFVYILNKKKFSKQLDNDDKE